VPSEKIVAFSEIQPARFSHVRRLAFENPTWNRGILTYKVELELATGIGLVGPTLSLAFIDAVEIHLGNLNWPGALRLAIYDVSAWQREGVRYAVNDEEQDLAISLQCADFEFRLCGQT
jgi:hypothetical protein